jgi:hypothetical protein
MNIIELAKQARFFVVDGEVYSPSNQADHELTEFVKAFAALVEAAARADEREKCSRTRAGKPRILPSIGMGALWPEQSYCFTKGWHEGAASVRKAIRARGTT